MAIGNGTGISTFLYAYLPGSCQTAYWDARSADLYAYLCLLGELQTSYLLG